MVPLVIGIIAAMCLGAHGGCDFHNHGHDRYVEADWYQHSDNGVTLNAGVKTIDEPIASTAAFLDYCEKRHGCNETAHFGGATLTLDGVCHRIFVLTDNKPLMDAIDSEMNAQCNHEA